MTSRSDLAIQVTGGYAWTFGRKMSNHKILALVAFSLIFIGCDCGKPSDLERSQEIQVEKDQIIVLGFVANLGPKNYKTGMTIADALELAGGYGECENCAKNYPSHPTYRLPPTLSRRGKNVDLKSLRSREDWLNVALEPGDILTFKHILF